MGPTFTYVELDDRREFWALLARLSVSQRIDWLRWCCREASAGRGVTVYVTASTGSVPDVWHDAVTIFGQGGLTVDRAGVRLRELVNGKGE